MTDQEIHEAQAIAADLEARLREGTRHGMTLGHTGHQVALLLPYLRHLEARAALPTVPAAAPVAQSGWVSVHERLPEEGAEPTYVLGLWEDGDIRRCQIYNGQLDCAFPARGDYPTHWAPDLPKPAPLKQDGYCIACQYPRYVLRDQQWGSCCNSECLNHQVDMASASYSLDSNA